MDILTRVRSKVATGTKLAVATIVMFAAGGVAFMVAPPSMDDFDGITVHFQKSKGYCMLKQSVSQWPRYDDPDSGDYYYKVNKEDIDHAGEIENQCDKETYDYLFTQYCEDNKSAKWAEPVHRMVAFFDGSGNMVEGFCDEQEGCEPINCNDGGDDKSPVDPQGPPVSQLLLLDSGDGNVPKSDSDNEREQVAAKKTYLGACMIRSEDFGDRKLSNLTYHADDFSLTKSDGKKSMGYVMEKAGRVDDEFQLDNRCNIKTYKALKDIYCSEGDGQPFQTVAVMFNADASYLSYMHDNYWAEWRKCKDFKYNPPTTTPQVSSTPVGKLLIQIRSNDTGVNKDRVFLAGAQDVTIGKVKLTAVDEDVLVQDIFLTNIGNLKGFSSDVIQYTCLFDGGTKLACANPNTLANTNIEIKGLNYTVKKGSKILEIRATSKPMSNAAIGMFGGSGYYTSYFISSSQGHVKAMGVSSKVTYKMEDGNKMVESGEIAFDRNLNDVYAELVDQYGTDQIKKFYRAGSKITNVQLVSSYGGEAVDTSFVGPGQYTMAILALTTASHGNTDSSGIPLKLGINEFRFDVKWSNDLLFSTLSLERIGGVDGAKQHFSTSYHSNGIDLDMFLTNAKVSFPNDYLIDAGTTAYYVVKGSLFQATSTMASTTMPWIQFNLDDLKGSPGDVDNNIDWWDGADNTYATANDFDYLLLDTTSIVGTKITSTVMPIAAKKYYFACAAKWNSTTTIPFGGMYPVEEYNSSWYKYTPVTSTLSETDAIKACFNNMSQAVSTGYCTVVDPYKQKPYNRYTLLYNSPSLTTPSKAVVEFPAYVPNYCP